MLAEWKLEPDTAQRLAYRSGSLTPIGSAVDASGFAELARMLGNDSSRTRNTLLATMALLGLAIGVWRAGMRRRARVFALILGCAAFALAGLALLQLAESARGQSSASPSTITFLAPVQQPGSTLTAEISNTPNDEPARGLISAGWPVLLAVVAWVTRRRLLVLGGWVLLAWAALRLENGAAYFFAVVGLFAIAQIALPAVLRLIKRSTAIAALLLAGLVTSASAQQPPPRDAAIAESVVQQIRVDEKFATATATIR